MQRTREQDVQFVSNQAGVSLEQARFALDSSEGDAVQAIMLALDGRELPVQPRGEQQEPQERTYQVLAVQIRHAPQQSTTDTDSVRSVLDKRRSRLKGPTKEFMTLADSVQDDLPEGIYLKMANAAKGMYEVIEELDPTTVEGYRVRGAEDTHGNSEERIAELEEQLRQRDESLDSCQDELRAKHRELQKLNSMQTAIMRNEQAAINQWEAHCNVIKALEGHRVIGPHVAFSKAMTSIVFGTDLLKHGDSNLPRKWKALRSGVWNRRSFEIESVKYDKTEYTEGFGSSGMSLVELADLIHSPDWE